jgi:hypothetical protein
MRKVVDIWKSDRNKLRWLTYVAAFIAFYTFVFHGLSSSGFGCHSPHQFTTAVSAQWLYA